MINKLCAIYLAINLNSALSIILNPKLSRLGVEESLFFLNPFYFNYFHNPTPTRPFEQINLVKVLFGPKFGPNFPTVPPIVSPFSYPWINHQPNYEARYQPNFESNYQPYHPPPLIFSPFGQSINSMSGEGFSNGHSEQVVKDVDPDVMRFINQLDLDRIVDELENNYHSIDPKLPFQGAPEETDDLGNVEENRYYNDPFWKENDKEGKVGFNNPYENDDNFEKFLDEDDAEDDGFDSEKDKLPPDQGYGGQLENDDHYDPFFDKDKNSESDKTNGHQEMSFNSENNGIKHGGKFAYYDHKGHQRYPDDTHFQTTHQGNNGIFYTPDGKKENLPPNVYYNPLNPVIDPLPGWRPYFDYSDEFLLQLYQNRKAKKLIQESIESTVQVDQHMPKEENQTTTIAPTY